METQDHLGASSGEKGRSAGWLGTTTEGGRLAGWAGRSVAFSVQPCVLLVTADAHTGDGGFVFVFGVVLDEFGLGRARTG